MEWELLLQRDQWLIDVQTERGQPLPDWYTDEPVIEPADRFILDGFWRLSTCRMYGMGFIGPIPNDKIEEYAERRNMCPPVAEMFAECVREMDAGYLAFQVSEAKKHAKAPPPVTSPSAPKESPTSTNRRRRRR